MINTLKDYLHIRKWFQTCTTCTPVEEWRDYCGCMKVTAVKFEITVQLKTHKQRR